MFKIGSTLTEVVLKSGVGDAGAVMLLTFFGEAKSILIVSPAKEEEGPLEKGVLGGMTRNCI